MSERRTVKTVLQYEVDKNSTRQAVESADTVERAVTDITQDFQRLGPVAKAATASIRLGFSGLKKDAETLDNRLEQVEDSFESVGRAARRASEAGAGGFRTTTESAGDVGSLLSAAAGLDSLGGGTASRVLGEFGQVGDVIEALGRLPSAFQDVTEAIGVTKTAGLVGGLALVSVAAIALTVVFADVAKAQEEAAKRAEEYRGKIAEIGDVLAQGQGSAGIQGLIENARDNQASIEFQRAFAQGLVDQVTAAVPDGGPGEGFNTLIKRSSLLSDLTGGQLQRFDQLQVTVEDLGKQAEAAAAQVYLFEQQLASTDVQAQDAAIAEQNRLAALTESAARRSSIEADTARFLENATSNSADARVNAAQAEIDRLTRLNEQLAYIGDETSEALIAENQKRIDEQVIIRDTTTALRGAVDERSAFIRVFDLLNKGVGNGINAFNDGIERLGDNFERLQPAFETISKITKEQAESAAKLAEIARQQADAETKARNDRDKNRLEAEYQLDRDLEEQEIEHKARLLEINRRANASISNAIGARDALAAFMAQQTRRQETREENRNNREAIRKLNATFKEQQRVIDQRYAEQLAAAKSAAERATEIERARLQVQVDALNQQLQNQQRYADSYLQINDITNATVLQGAVKLQSDIANLWGVWEMNAAATAAAEEYAQQQQNLGLTATGGGRAYGGAVNSGQRVLVGEKGPEVVYFRSPGMVMSNRASRSMGGGGMPITLNMVGQTDAQIARTAGREVEMYINRLLKASKQRQGRTS